MRSVRRRSEAVCTEGDCIEDESVSGDRAVDSGRKKKFVSCKEKYSPSGKGSESVQQ